MPSRATSPGKRLAHVSTLLPLAIGLANGLVTKPSPSESPSSPIVVSGPSGALTPLLEDGQPVDWWFVFKFNAASFSQCGGAQRTCTFGGEVQPYKTFGQQFAFASSVNHALQKGGGGCVGETAADPVGATFASVYNGDASYVIWNDQLYDDPTIQGCTKECGAPWGHSKGLLAWDEAGEGLVLQVSTPSWPAAGSATSPRKTDGNTLGCVKDNDVEVSQHFFSKQLTKDDLVKVLKALANASVVTDPKNRQLVHNGGPADVQSLVNSLGTKSSSKAVSKDVLSSGVILISKPSGLNVPPWQMVSSVLGQVPLRTATWWTKPEIPTTDSTTAVGCWDGSLARPEAVEIATKGTWAGQTFGLTGGSGPDFNHAKIGVSTSGARHYVIFGDMNQQGSLSGPNCASSQNGRGGLFYVLDDSTLSSSVAELIKGDTAPSR